VHFLSFSRCRCWWHWALNSGPCLLGRCSPTWATHTHSPFCFSLFFRENLVLLSRLAICESWVARITGMNHHIQNLG
jgi:hypothetical protein